MFNKQVTVLGGGTFLDKYVVKGFAEAGAFVKVSVAEVYSSQSLRTFGAVGQVELIEVKKSLSSRENILNAIKGSKVVVCLDCRCKNEVVNACKGSQVESVIFVSSAAGCNGESTFSEDFTEGVNLQAAIPKLTDVHLGVVVGEGDSFLCKIAAFISFFRFIFLPKDSLSKVPLVYVKDVADAIVKIAENSALYAGQTFKLHSEDSLSLKEIVHYVARQINVKEKVFFAPKFLLKIIFAFEKVLPFVDSCLALSAFDKGNQKCLGFFSLKVQPRSIFSVLEKSLKFHIK